MNAIIVSDVHLRDSKSVKSKLVIRFFQEVASQFEKIYILGDLFDVWPGTSPYLLKEFSPVLQALAQLVQDGHQVHYIEGNHDFRLGAHFSSTLGISVHPDFLEQDWNGRRVYMAHGDLGNPRDLGYRALRKLLRLELLHSVIKPIPDQLIFQIGLQSSKMSRQAQRTSSKIETNIRQTYRRTAETIFRQGYDLVFMGHTHLPDDVTTRIGNRTCRYINTGDWVKHFTYLEFDGSHIYTKTHPLTNLS